MKQSKTMSKETKKTKAPRYNRQVIETLVVKYGLSDYYIRKCVSGNLSSITADKIKKEYKDLNKTFEFEKQKFINKN